MDFKKKSDLNSKEKQELMIIGAGATIVTDAISNLIINNILKSNISKVKLSISTTALLSLSSFGYMKYQKDEKGKYLGYGSLMGGAGATIVSALGSSKDPEASEDEAISFDEETFSSASAKAVEDAIGKVLKSEQLTEHFYLAEFETRDPIPPEYLDNVKNLAQNLEVLRNHLGARINIISGYRSPAHNAEKKGAKNSMHLYAKAGDMMIDGYTPQEVYNTIEKLIKEGKMTEGGLGIYNKFVHYDIRGTKARWDNR